MYLCICTCNKNMYKRVCIYIYIHVYIYLHIYMFCFSPSRLCWGGWPPPPRFALRSSLCLGGLTALPQTPTALFVAFNYLRLAPGHFKDASAIERLPYSYHICMYIYMYMYI